MTKHSKAQKFSGTTKPAGHASERGFALVITVSMLVLLTLMAVALLSLSSVTTRHRSISESEQEAQANARMALMNAIAELQAHMGPDQRISMTADQRMPLGSDGSISSAADGNRYWTGVYNAWPATEENRPDPSTAFRSWLVSGDPAMMSGEAAPDTALSNTNSVELVAAGTVGMNNEARHVRVPIVDVQPGSRQQGRMAWWVGDQGVKAALSTPLPADDDSLDLANRSKPQITSFACIAFT